MQSFVVSVQKLRKERIGGMQEKRQSQLGGAGIKRLQTHGVDAWIGADAAWKVGTD